MNNDVAIKVEGLSKHYRIGEKQAYYTLAEQLVSFFRHPFNIGKRDNKADFWALKNVSFEVKKGEVVGIIGRNGSGKSTLLKILSRITDPTKGKITMQGRVASLLEVGTGFSPELTGRENIYLNGSILGMSKKEIESKFDEIVAFSGVEQFLDTPVKRYSSGMYVRLAFAVAAHLDSDILLVDEVLAVGDAEFQKKCLGKMKDLADGGRTVLFVSHDMNAVKNLCSRALLLDEGNLVVSNDTFSVVKQYFSFSTNTNNNPVELIQKIKKNNILEIISLSIQQNNEDCKTLLDNGLPICISIKYKLLQLTTDFRIYIDVYNSENELLFRSFQDELDYDHHPQKQGVYVSTCTIPANILNSSPHKIRIGSSIFNKITILNDELVFSFDIVNSSKYNSAYPNDKCRGKIALFIPWNTSVL